MITFTEIKLVIFGIALVAALIYTYHLKSEIQRDEIQILTLTNTIIKQNDTVKSASDATIALQNKIDNISKENKAIVITATKFKTIIQDRPISTTCSDAVSTLEATATAIATDWNSK